MEHTNRGGGREGGSSRKLREKIDGENGDEHVPRYTTSLIIPNVDIIYLATPALSPPPPPPSSIKTLNSCERRGRKLCWIGWKRFSKGETKSSLRSFIREFLPTWKNNPNNFNRIFILIHFLQIFRSRDISVKKYTLVNKWILYTFTIERKESWRKKKKLIPPKRSIRKKNFISWNQSPSPRIHLKN